MRDGCVRLAVLCRSVVMAALRDEEPIFRRAIDEAMLLVDSPRPPATQFAPQRLRFADALKR